MFILFIISEITFGCQINGYESGVCSQRVQISDGVEFCNNELDDYVCVPEIRKLWPDHTIENRDKEIRLDFVAYVRDRLVQEINGDVESVLIKDDTCYKAYKQFLCKWNFPPCDAATNLTIPICQSSCTSYYENCGLNLTPCLQYFQKLKPGLDQNC
ncbi:unnamed protein product [Paramecium primaurelia]|uniref:FZ domain-containing protein n=1 Tax=Paramecium primaurelia TaxID=5886 RepID=A0A8S1QDA9_PARPR|nr:unnamed protein product [Paramecium primaurelia]